MVTNLTDHPDHYTFGIETIDFIKAKLTQDEFKGFLKGNIIKYISRSNFKNSETQDYEKAKWYLDKLVDLEKHSEKETK